MAAALQPKNTESDYTRRLKVFLDKTRQNEKLYEYLSDILPSAIAAIGYDLNQQSHFNVLSIGSGDGQTDLEILKTIKKDLRRSKALQCAVRPIKIFHRAIEPNETAMAIYRGKVKRLQDQFSTEEVTFDLSQPRTFEDYAVQPNDDIKFDLVHFMHCLYYIDVEEALVHCYNTELREKGMIMICISALNDLMASLETQDKISGLPKYGLKNGNISSVLQKYSWKFEEHILEHEYDISDVFDQNSEEGNLLLDFIRFQVNFRSNNSPEDVRGFLDKIKKYCQCKDGKYFVKMFQRIVLIRK